MSRTIRRRGELHEYRWILSDYFLDGLTLVKYQVNPKTKEGKKRIKKFHGDSTDTMMMVPKHFRQMLNRISRRREKAELCDALKDLNSDKCANIGFPRKRDALWKWW